MLIRVSVLPNRDFFVPKLSGLIDGTKEKKGVANATPFFVVSLLTTRTL